MADKGQIAFLCHPYHRGGVTRWMADAAMAYADARWEVYFVTVDPSVVFFSGEGRETMTGLLQKQQEPVQLISTPVGRSFELGTPEYRVHVYRSLLQKVPTGIPVILSDDAVVWAAACSLHMSYPLVGVLHADDEHYYKYAGLYYDKVATLVCVSERVRNTAMQRVPQIKSDNIYTIPCGIHLPAANITARDSEVLRLAYVGRITEYQKRVSDLAEICRVLDRQQVSFHLEIIGDGVDRAKLEQKFKDAGLQHRVTFHGWLSQDKVAEWLAGADILLLTSDFEGTPISMMEALAAGCGFVGTRVSGIEDYEHHSLAPSCLSVFTVGDINDAVAKIKVVASVDAATRRQAARKLAEAEFSMEVCLDKYSKVLAVLKPANKPLEQVRFPLSKLIYSKVLALARYAKARISGT